MKNTTDAKNTKKDGTLSPYRLLSDNRTALMGLATLWVIYNHAMLLGLTAQAQPFEFIQLAAHISVDIFFFLSGFGIYHSLLKNSVRDYFLKRLSRLLPVWGSFLLAHIVIDYLVFHLTFSIKEIIGFISFQGFTAQLGNQGNWYVYTLFVYYLIAPVPFSFLKESRHRFMTCAALTFLCWFVSYSYFGNRDLLIGFIRIPAFIMGMYMASAADSETGSRPAKLPGFLERLANATDSITASVIKQLTGGGLAVCIAITLFFGTLHFFVLTRCSFDVLWDYGLWWHALIPMVIPFSLIVCRLFALGDPKKNLLLLFLGQIGSASLEIFLAHLYIFKYWGEITGILLRRPVSFRIAVIFASILIGWCWHKLIIFLRGILSRY